ncbi:MAG: SDR family NAD(P)-dependent oxidoreductase [Pseudomonadota bacterium]
MSQLGSEMNHLHKYQGAWAVVTGASDGIGEAFVHKLAENDINVVLVARRKMELEKVASTISTQHRITVKIIVADLSTESGILDVLTQTNDLDVGLYVGAAGFGTSGEFVNTSIEQELNMIDVNCKAIVHHSQAFAQRFKSRGCGVIILLSSLLAFQGAPRAANYAATKAFIQTFAEGLHVELAPHNIDVLSVAPGPVKSGFATRADMNMLNADTPNVVARRALDRLGKCFTTRPGFLGKLLGYSLSLTPRWGRIQIMTRVMAGMTSRNISEDEPNEAK